MKRLDAEVGQTPHNCAVRNGFSMTGVVARLVGLGDGQIGEEKELKNACAIDLIYLILTICDNFEDEGDNRYIEFDKLTMAFEVGRWGFTTD